MVVKNLVALAVCVCVCVCVYNMHMITQSSMHADLYRVLRYMQANNITILNTKVNPRKCRQVLEFYKHSAAYT